MRLSCDVAEAVDVEHRRVDPVAPTSGCGQVEPDERVGVERRAELGERDAEREVRGRRREDVAAVERARDRLERVLRVRELVRARRSRRAPRPGTSRPLSGPT